MNLRRLELFVAVAEELHFNRAAQRLHMAQPPLSQQIHKLEQECKVALFLRNSRNVELTAEGEVLLVHARKVLAQAAALEAALAHAKNGELGRVRLGFVSSAATAMVPSLVRCLRTQWPGIELELREETTDVQLELIAAGNLDAGIAREVRTVPGIRSAVLVHEPLVVAVAADHRLAGRTSMPLKDLKGEAFVAFPRSRVSSLYDHIAALLHAVEVDFDISQEAVQFPTILGLVSAHLGVAVVPESMRAFTIPGLVYVDIEDANAISTVSLIYPAEASNTLLVAKVQDAFSRILAPDTPGQGGA